MAKQHVLSIPGELRLLTYNEFSRKFVRIFLITGVFCLFVYLFVLYHLGTALSM